MKRIALGCAIVALLLVALIVMFASSRNARQTPQSGAAMDLSSNPAAASTKRPQTADVAPAAALPGGTASAAPEGINVRFKRSGQPGIGTMGVQRQTREDGSVRTVVTRASATGLLLLPGGRDWSLEVIDEPTSLTLVVLQETPPVGTTLDVWEPVRFVGGVDFGRIPPHRQVAVRLGTGPRELPSARVRRTRDSQLRVDPTEDAPWGLKLRPAPRDWRIISLDEGGIYTSPWMLSEFEPQLLATSATGTAGLAEGTFDGLTPRETRKLPIRLLPLTALEVSMDAPPDTEPLAVALGIRDAKVDPAWADEVAPIMSVIDVVNPALSDFLASRGNEFLDPERPLRLAPLPPFVSMTLVARGMTPAQTPVRELSVPWGEVTRVHFDVADLFPTVRSRARVFGRITVEGTGEPAANIRLTLSHALGKHEADTDSDGRYSFTDVPTEQEMSVFIEAYDERTPPRFSRSLTEPIDAIPVDQIEVVKNFEVPGFRWLIVEDPAGDLKAGAEDTVIVALEHQQDGEWRDFTRVLDFNFTDEGCEAEIRIPGAWRAKALVGDGWIERRSGETTFGPTDSERRVVLAPAADGATPRQMRVLLPDGNPAVGVTVFMAPRFPDAQPFETMSDANGNMATPPTTFNQFRVRVDMELLEFGGEVTVTKGSVGTIQLQRVVQEPQAIP
ncbi:hypothetical protein GC173_10035 [bacterium]|nr:hypothetical protein [bacterium]